MAESVRTIVVAAVANLGIAAAKAAGGVLSGSSAMLSEAAHSVADTTTEVLLLVAVTRGNRPAGLVLTSATGDSLWDGLASIVIGSC